jgi:hypothetical protein
VITREQAVELARRGLPWHPAAGDRFHVPDRDLDEEVFVVSGMSIEIADLPSGTEMRFNGTVEWALDSIAQAEVIWLPREDQLRALLGEAFEALERVPGPPEGYAVTAAGARGALARRREVGDDNDGGGDGGDEEPGGAPEQ